MSTETEICNVLDGIWAEITEMLKELINRKVDIPQATRIALDGAKVLINLCKFHPRLAHDVTPSMLDSVQGFCVGCCGADVVSRIVCELKTAQDLITIKAVSVVDESVIISWQKKLEELWSKVSKNFQKKDVVTSIT
ncbi:MAG: hypothetical protein QW640_05355 [Nitrososphaerota archaeon]